MKTMKKLFGFLLVMAMLVAATMTVFADGHTITIENKVKGDKHSYQAYQIFSGTAEQKDETATGKLEGLAWGTGVDSEKLLTALAAKNSDLGTAFTTTMSAAEAAAEMNKITANDKIKVLASVIGENLTTTTTGTFEEKDDAYKAEVVDGYYLVKDAVNTATTEGQGLTNFILQVNGDVNVTSKNETTTSQKKVKDVNDSVAGSETDWQDSADYDIGDYVPFQLSATIAADYADYKGPYKLTFHDTMSEGLTFVNDEQHPLVVKVGTTVIANTNYEVKTDNVEKDTFQVSFSDLKEISGVEAGSVITVEYYGRLNEKAEIGSKGNPNESYVTFSNNPTDSQGGEKGSTPVDKVIVFTYNTIVNKKAENKNGADLAGAGFTLYKKVEGHNSSDEEKENAGDGFKEVKKIEATEFGTTFAFEGLDDGTYTLVETTVPKGYNKMANVVFEINATHTQDTDKDPLQLTGLSGKVESGEAEFAVDTTAGSLTTSVVNKSGSTLPTTGGMGTRILYILGTILALGAGTLLVVRKRMAA